MLRKILTIAFVAALLFSFGCKKKEAAPAPAAAPEVQKQVEQAGKEAAKEGEAAKQEAGKAVEEAGKEIQKDANAK
ncbi:MAG: hypothetical protein WCE45_01455 [Sedimentisphaerales bacterium]